MTSSNFSPILIIRTMFLITGLELYLVCKLWLKKKFLKSPVRLSQLKILLTKKKQQLLKKTRHRRE